MFDFITADAMSALMQVIIIDLVLAGDNAIVIALAAAGLPQAQRARAIMIGIAAATIMRIVFAAMTTQLLAVFGLLLAGGLLLLWVCWKMWRELQAPAEHQAHADAINYSINADGSAALKEYGNAPREKTLMQATGQIIVADVSMSLDNVLAVAGAAREHPWVLIFGLVLSIVLMGAAASYVARLLQKYRWIAYVGLAIILYVALDMIYRGGFEVWPVAKALASSLKP
jgi:YjbE family integral membrane protein